jgi:hypothetical protein
MQGVRICSNLTEISVADILEMFDPGLAFVNSQVHYDLDSLSSRNSIITT